MRGRYVNAFLAAMLAGGLYAGQATAATRTFFAVLNAGQETPPNDSNALGVAYLTFDDKTLKVCYSVSYISLSGPASAAHIHGPAAPGVSAAVLVALSPTANPLNGCVTRRRQGATRPSARRPHAACPSGGTRGSGLPRPRWAAGTRRSGTTMRRTRAGAPPARRRPTPDRAAPGGGAARPIRDARTSCLPPSRAGRGALRRPPRTVAGGRGSARRAAAARGSAGGGEGAAGRRVPS
ncbi:MAG: CHRD domain-containing protein, partial [Deltaproteobacteria bacterium]